MMTRFDSSQCLVSAFTSVSGILLVEKVVNCGRSGRHPIRSSPEVKTCESYHTPANKTKIYQNNMIPVFGYIQ